ncbi:MAG: hypothetical protein Q8M96_12735, partial [Rubrivivax sp.]|nr:hypothetical protein [Rubrivivax sp.]
PSLSSQNPTGHIHFPNPVYFFSPGENPLYKCKRLALFAQVFPALRQLLDYVDPEYECLGSE